MYDEFAPFYDLFLEVDLSEWTNQQLALTEGLMSGAEVGCGSGLFLRSFLQNGKNVIGVDPSLRMLQAAKERLKKDMLFPILLCQKGEELQLNKEVEFITAINDVVNYMQEPSDFFSAARRNLKKGGLILFDISSPEKLKKKLGNNIFCFEKENATLVWKNFRGNNFIDMELTIFKKEGELYRRYDESQRQYVHTPQKILAELEKNGFSARMIECAADKKDRLQFIGRKEG